MVEGFYLREVREPAEGQPKTETVALIIPASPLVLEQVVTHTGNGPRSTFNGSDDPSYVGYMQGYGEAQSARPHSSVAFRPVSVDLPATLLSQWGQYKATKGNGDEFKAREALGQTLAGMIAQLELTTTTP